MKYEDIFSFENLYTAHMQARKCKRNKKDVIEFELSLSTNLWDLYDRLQNRTYKVDGYNHFTIYEPKRREIQALSYKDRVVQHCLCDNYLYPLLTRHFIYDNGACQRGKGTDFALDRLSAFFHSYYTTQKTNQGYILKADIRHYFPSIRHDILKSRLRKVISDRDMVCLLNKIIDSYSHTANRGLPMGNQTSQLFALYYLDQVDRLVKEQLGVRYYVRYMDDMIIVHSDKRFLQFVLWCMQGMLENLGLEFNEKTQIFPIKNGVEFLGFHVYMTESGKVIRKVKTQTKVKYKKRMKKMRADFQNGVISLEDVQKTLPGFKGHLERGHTYYLRKAVLKDFVLLQKKEEDVE